MPDDPKVVEDVVPEVTPSPEVKPEVEPEVEPQPQPLTEEKIDQMIAEKVASATSVATETAKREIQSVKDRAKQEVESAQRRARIAEDRTAGIKSSLGDLDEDARLRVENADLRARDSHYQSFEAEESARRQFRETYDAFNANMNQFVTDMGVDPKEINWGDEGEPLLQKQQRILGEVGKIQKTKDKELKDSIPRLVKEEVARERQAQGLDSVPTDTSGGVSGSDADFMAKFGSGDLPTTKANIDRYDKIKEQYK